MGELRQSILRKSFAQPTRSAFFAAEARPESSTALVNTKPPQSKVLNFPKWELSRVVTGHNGWIHSIAVDPDNGFYATGSADQTIKIWSLASGELRLTLTGHKMAVRAVTISEKLPYLFSASEDKSVFCWDLEHNQVVRQYHGHRSGVYCAALHPSIPNILVTGSRDSSARVWDVRTRACVHVLQGHDGAVNTVAVQDEAPQIITGSQDRTVRLWDLVSGKCEKTITNHENSIRALAIHPRELTFVSGARDGLKQWKLPEGSLLGDYGKYTNDGITMMALDDENDSIFIGYEGGVVRSFSYPTGQPLQELQTPPTPASLSSEAAVLCGALDVTRTRLLTGHMDKTIRTWKQVS